MNNEFPFTTLDHCVARIEKMAHGTVFIAPLISSHDIFQFAQNVFASQCKSFVAGQKAGGKRENGPGKNSVARQKEAFAKKAEVTTDSSYRYVTHYHDHARHSILFTKTCIAFRAQFCVLKQEIERFAAPYQASWNYYENCTF